QPLQRPKYHKHVVSSGRLHTRVPSSKALPKNHATSTTKFNQTRRHVSPSPERPERPPMLLAAHRRTTSDVRLSRDNSATNLKKNSSHTSLKRNRSHVEVGKRAKSGTNIKRTSSQKEISKLKGGAKSQVHFDLGNDGQEDDEGEWVDASGSASPYLSRRGSVAGSVPSSGKVPASLEVSPQRHTPPTVPNEECETPERDTAHRKISLTSRLLQRTPSHGAPPQMSIETVRVHPHSPSPDSGLSRASSTLYGTPKTTRAGTGLTGTTLVGSKDELTSRFVDGPSSVANPDAGSFYSRTRATARQNDRDRVRRPRSLADLQQEHRDSATDEPEEENGSALAPRTRRSGYRAPPAETSRTQQKLNLQRASSSMEPTQGSGSVGAVGASPLVGGGVYDTRDPRIGKMLDRTGSEYLVVRRYQNPIARSIARLHQLPNADKRQLIPKQNGHRSNGSTHNKKTSNDSRGYGLNESLVPSQRSRPPTPRRTESVRTNGANSSFEAEEDRIQDRLSGSGFVDGDDNTVAALLRNLWDKNLDLSASQD
ncbi:uncharacterized protein BCR38DRAFT_313113, partial [Pseudomassariella vexata]